MKRTIRKNIAILAVLISAVGTTYGQLQQDVVLSSYGNQTTIEAAGSVTLKAGFHIPAGRTVLIRVTGEQLQLQPDAGQNYILRTAYLQGTATTQASGRMQDVEYYDGLGRPVQSVQGKAGPAYRDIISVQSYDAFGRAERSYLPYAAVSGNNGKYRPAAVTEQAAFYNNGTANGVVTIAASGGSTPSFARPVYEASPLNRVLEQGFPGAAWQPGTRGTNTGRTVVTEYTANNTTAITDLANTRLAKLYTVSYDAAGRPKLNLSGNYAANELYVTVTKNENWAGGSGTFAARLNTAEEYTDKQGRLVLKRTFNAKTVGTTVTNEILSTYYVYDDFGNLCFVLTPGVNADSARPTEAQLKAYCYMYQYDGRNRMKRRHLPGHTKWESFNYNMMDQLILHETARDSSESYSGFATAAGKRYHHFYKYDGQGRLIMQGVEKDREASQETIAGYIAEPGRATTQWEVRSSATGNFHGYTNVSIPNTPGNLDVTEVLYYDRYEGIGLPGNLNKVGTAGISSKTQGLMVAKKTKVLNTADVYLWTVYYYDERGDNVRTLSQHYRGGAAGTNNYDDIVSEYTFTHKLEKSTRSHYAGASTAALTVTTEYTYDHRDRLIDTWKTVTGGARTLIARNEYNGIGQLRAKNLHSGNQGGVFGQQIAYTYNERGWLRTAGTDQGLFNLTLHYNTGTDKFYNGNIGYQEFSRKHTDGSSTAGTYAYKYDALDRLTNGYLTGDLGKEQLSYDKLGNIASLKRSAGSSALVDDLAYSYEQGRLTKITDAVTASGTGNPYQLAGTTQYTYDANGNMKTRLNTAGTDNNITGTVYNYLDLPQTVTANGATVTYVYDGSGRKLRSTNGINGQTRDYIDGIEYSGTALELIHMEEGRIVNGSSGYSYEYVLKDHLGSARSGFKGTNAAATASNLGSDYYPFGLQYQSKIGQTSPKNNYLYNGKELQDGLKQYDYGFRFYDPVIGRWGSVDPLAEKYYSLSPFAYVANNPINSIDPNGKEIIFIVRGNGGQKDRLLTYRDGNLYWNGSGELYQNKGANNTVWRTLQVYRKILKSGDDVLINQLTTLEKSDLKHYVEESPNSENAVSPTGRGKGNRMGTQTEFDFSEKKKEKFLKSEGVESTDMTTVVHEMRHQYDYDIGNMTDREKPASSKSPQEIRAVNNENRARKIEKVGERTTYGGEKIDPDKLKNPPNNR